MERRTRILLVEDEIDVMNANRQYLLDRGYEVRCADTLHDARTSLWEYPPDLILLDVMLPDGSGYDLCREIRAMSAVPIIFLTALGADGNVISGLEMGGDDYIVKPYSLDVMGARVTALLRRRGIMAGQIDLPPLQIDVAAGNVHLGGQEVSLTRKQIQLLVFFVEHQGQEVSPAQIYAAVWGADPGTMGSTVRSNVSRLRQKIALDGSGCFELTTAGQGYVFLRVRYPPEG